MDRGTDNRVRSYLRQVDALMESRVGVSFTGNAGIQVDVAEAGGIELASEMRGGLSPDGFVGLVCRTFPLRPVEGNEASAVAIANRGTMALAVFARHTDDWGLGADGSAYREHDEGIERISFGKDHSGTKHGFVVSFAEGAALAHSEDGRPVAPEGAEFVPVAGALDIGDAVAKFEQVMESRRDAAPSIH